MAQLISTDFFSTIPDKKAALRQQMKACRAAVSQSECAAASHRINERLIAWLAPQEFSVVAVFLAMAGEPDLERTARYLGESGVTIVAPRLDLAKQEMRFYALPEWGQWEIGPFGVRQPSEGEAIQDISLMLVPGLAFDGAGGRLGMGGGWYDRVLPTTKLAIGVAFDWQILAQVPMEPHDARVDALVTENQGVSAAIL